MVLQALPARTVPVRIRITVTLGLSLGKGENVRLLAAGTGISMGRRADTHRGPLSDDPSLPMEGRRGCLGEEGLCLAGIPPGIAVRGAAAAVAFMPRETYFVTRFLPVAGEGLGEIAMGQRCSGLARPQNGVEAAVVGEAGMESLVRGVTFRKEFGLVPDLM